MNNLVEYLLGPLRGALCHDTKDRKTKKQVYVDVAMEHNPAHSDWVLLSNDKTRVEGAVAAALTRVLGLEGKPIVAEAQVHGYWGAEDDVLGFGMVRMLLRTA